LKEIPAMQRWLRLGIVLLAALVAVQWWSDPPPDQASRAPAPSSDASDAGETAARWPAFLPPEAVATLEAIERGGPFPYDRDGSVFQNRERLLPQQPRGYYREYTVVTPGSRDRGARRIVAGGQPPDVYYYTDDHYRSFRRVEARP
jgi:guanyl-specific ribonuclease Sa